MSRINKICLLLFTAFFLSANIAGAEDIAPAIEKVHFFSSTENDADPATALTLFQHDNVETKSGHIFNLGLAQGYYWLKVDINNVNSPKNSLRLVTHAAYRPLITAYLVEQNHYTEILHSTNNDVYSNRPQPFRLLSSKAFSITQPDAFILIRYQVIGSSLLKLQLLNELQFNQLLHDDTSQASVFYSFSIACIIIFLFFSAAMQEKISLYYSLIFTVALLFITAIEGFAFKHFWPESPVWNHYSPLVLLYFLSAAGFYLSSIGNQLRQQQKLFNKTTRLFAVICLLLAASCLLFDFVLLAIIANILFALMFISQTICIASWVKTGPQYNKVTLGVALLLTLFVISMVLLSLTGTLFSSFVYFSANRIVYLIATLVTISAIILHVAHLRKSHEQSLQRELELSKRDADKSKALFQAQQNFNRAQSLATLHQQQLASASHDMKQPLISLRSTIDASMQDASTEIKQQLHNALDYLNNLCNQHLQQSNPQTEEPATQQEENSTEEPYALQLLFDTVIRMFNAEALEKNIELRCQPCTVIIREPATIIMRILSNLIGNAIKHSQNGKVLLGVRRRGHKLDIQVHDSGPGMTEEQLQTLSQAYQKGPESEGHGLGLAICQQLASQHGMQLEIYSVLGRGTSCCLQISRVML